MSLTRCKRAAGWTDEVRIGIGPTYEPTEADREWLARELGGEDDADEALPDEVVDELGREREAEDALERGLLF